MTTESIWTEERVQQLRDCLAINMSFGRIALTLGMGITRNMVAGKLYRLGLSEKRPEPSAPRIKYVSEKTYQPVKITVARCYARDIGEGKPVTLAPTPTRLCTILNLSHKTCKWPIGDPRDKGFHFCGHPPSAKGPYCSYHTQAAIVPLTHKHYKIGKPA
jgi:GcrA cell cycle regulator